MHAGKIKECQEITMATELLETCSLFLFVNMTVDNVMFYEHEIRPNSQRTSRNDANGQCEQCDKSRRQRYMSTM